MTDEATNIADEVRAMTMPVSYLLCLHSPINCNLLPRGSYIHHTICYKRKHDSNSPLSLARRC